MLGSASTTSGEVKEPCGPKLLTLKESLLRMTRGDGEVVPAPAPPCCEGDGKGVPSSPAPSPSPSARHQCMPDLKLKIPARDTPESRYNLLVAKSIEEEMARVEARKAARQCVLEHERAEAEKRKLLEEKMRSLVQENLAGKGSGPTSSDTVTNSGGAPPQGAAAAAATSDPPPEAPRKGASPGLPSPLAAEQQVYCVCRQPYNEMRPMLACDLCDEWFHYECVGLLPPGTVEEDCEIAPDDYHCQKCCEKTGRRYPQAEDGKSTGIVHDECMLRHQYKEGGRLVGGHVENPNRITKALKRLRVRGIVGRCKFIQPRLATDEELLAVHTEGHIRSVMSGEVADKKREAVQIPISPGLSKKDKAFSPGGAGNNEEGLGDEDEEGAPDIYYSEGTGRAAKMAAGCAVAATEEVLSSSLQNAFALVRPPGHHAEHECAMGFCFFNNCAVAAKAALKNENVNRVMIIDWDVHHGNGISNVFYGDNSVLYLSLHRYGKYFFPGTGAADEAGEGKGAGYTVNIPFEATGLGDIDYLAAFQLVVEPIGKQFKPDLVIVACGFDAAKGDPLGEMLLSPAGFYHMTARTAANIQSRMTVVLEGGYNHTNVAKCSEAVVSALLGDSVPLIKANLEDSVNPHTIKALKKVIRVQRKHWNCFDTTAHRACLATGAHQLRVSDLQLAKHTSLLKKHALQRSQTLEYGKILPTNQKGKRASGKSRKTGGFRLHLKGQCIPVVDTKNTKKTSAKSSKRKRGSGSLNVTVPDSKTGISPKGRYILPKPTGKVGAGSPDSYESSMSPLQQRKQSKMLESPSEARYYLVDEFTTSLEAILRSMVEGTSSEALVSKCPNPIDAKAGASASPKNVEQAGKACSMADKKATVEKAGSRPVVQNENAAKEVQQLTQELVNSGSAAMKQEPTAIAKVVLPKDLQSQLATEDTLVARVSKAAGSVLNSLPAASKAASIPVASVLNTQNNNSAGLDLNALLFKSNLLVQQQQTQQMLNKALFNAAPTVSPNTALTMQVLNAQQAIPAAVSQDKLDTSSSDASKALFLRQAAQLLQASSVAGLQSQEPQGVAASFQMGTPLFTPQQQSLLSRIQNTQIPRIQVPSALPMASTTSLSQELQQLQQLQRLQQLQQQQRNPLLEGLNSLLQQHQTPSLDSLNSIASLPISQLQQLASQLGNTDN
ncbi:histone deacetylase [Chloropicon primus]|uniref:histone deacetylase n=3 Tax=Chloropicon primus TaxID=1764295 RepID=A0A5B8ME36_9CHLO|nr:histone deacetylase [Chloropicon primus]|eukprot:QDZ17610.1 histone deacetylase [Chloropicon primus]